MADVSGIASAGESTVDDLSDDIEQERVDNAIEALQEKFDLEVVRGLEQKARVWING